MCSVRKSDRGDEGTGLENRERTAALRGRAWEESAPDKSYQHWNSPADCRVLSHLAPRSARDKGRM